MFAKLQYEQAALVAVIEVAVTVAVRAVVVSGIGFVVGAGENFYYGSVYVAYSL